MALLLRAQHRTLSAPTFLPSQSARAHPPSGPADLAPPGADAADGSPYPDRHHYSQAGHPSTSGTRPFVLSPGSAHLMAKEGSSGSDDDARGARGTSPASLPSSDGDMPSPPPFAPLPLPALPLSASPHDPSVLQDFLKATLPLRRLTRSRHPASTPQRTSLAARRWSATEAALALPAFPASEAEDAVVSPVLAAVGARGLQRMARLGGDESGAMPVLGTLRRPQAIRLWEHPSPIEEDDT